MRLEKAQLAEKIEKEEPEKEDRSETKPTFTTPEPLAKAGFTTPEPLAPAPSERSDFSGKEDVVESPSVAKQEPTPAYTEEQLHTADEKRKGFWEKLSSITRSEWYKGPSKNRDLVNKQIIQVAEILSGKESAEIDMNDIQTARIFMFNGAPQKILKHPAFSYLESFYNYQSSQGCVGVNPEEVSLKQKKSNLERSLGTKKGRSFIEQLSTQKNGEVSKEETEGSSKKIKEGDLLENIFLN